MFSKLLFLAAGGGLAAYLYNQRRRGGLIEGFRPDEIGLDDSTDDRDVVDIADPTARDAEPTAMPASLDIDPADPVQNIDEVHEFHVEDLGADAFSQADVEAAQDMQMVEADLDGALDIEQPEDTTLDAIEASAHDVGDLYGVHTPPATDRTHPDGDASFDEGQNWLEALETDSVEMGAEAEVDLGDTIIDDDDVLASHRSDTKDTPVADRGSGGPAGI